MIATSLPGFRWVIHTSGATLSRFSSAASDSGQWCFDTLAISARAFSNEVSMIRWRRSGIALSALTKASLRVVSPLNTRLPAAVETCRPHACTTWFTGSGRKLRPSRLKVSPKSSGAKRSHGASALGIRRKSGHSFQLNRWSDSTSSTSGSACTVTGLPRRSPTLSSRSGSPSTWSRCAWVRNTWSIFTSCSKSSVVRPLPASISTSSSTSRLVVWRPLPMPPLQPNTVSFILFGGVDVHAVPVSRGRLGAEVRDAFEVDIVQRARRTGVEGTQCRFGGLPILFLIRRERGLEFCGIPACRIGQHILESERLIDGHRRLLALDAHHVDLHEGVYRVGVDRRLGDEDADAILLGDALEARAEVHRVAHHGVRHAECRAHVAHAHAAGVDADADLHLGPAARAELLVQLRQGGLHVDRGLYGAAGVVGEVHRRVPERHDGVADVLVDGAALLLDGARHRRHGGVEHLGELGRRQFLRE